MNGMTALVSVRPYKPKPELTDNWEDDWEGLVGSPRFEEARKRLGVKLEDLKEPDSLPASVGKQKTVPTTPGAVVEVKAQLATRQRQKRKEILRMVLTERELLLYGGDGSTSSLQQKETSSPKKLAAEARARNQAEVAQLRANILVQNEFQRKLLANELAVQLADVIHAEDLAQITRANQQAAREREILKEKQRIRWKEECKRQRDSTEAARLKKMEEEEAELQRRQTQINAQDKKRKQMRENAEAKRKADVAERERRWAEMRAQKVANVKMQIEQVREDKFSHYQAKHERLAQWRETERARQHSERMASREAELELSLRINEAMHKQQDEMKTLRNSALARHAANEQRQQRCAVDKAHDLCTKRKNNADRSQRRAELYAKVCDEEAHRRDQVRERLRQQELTVEQQLAEREARQEGRRVKAAAREEEKNQSVERSRRSYEHALHERELKVQQAEDRANWLAKERRALLEARQRTAQRLAVQRGRIEQQLDEKGGNIRHITRSPALLSSLGLSSSKLRAMSDSLLSARSMPTLLTASQMSNSSGSGRSRPRTAGKAKQHIDATPRPHTAASERFEPPPSADSAPLSAPLSATWPSTESALTGLAESPLETPIRLGHRGESTRPAHYGPETQAQAVQQQLVLAEPQNAEMQSSPGGEALEIPLAPGASPALERDSAMVQAAAPQMAPAVGSVVALELAALPEPEASPTTEQHQQLVNPISLASPLLE